MYLKIGFIRADQAEDRIKEIQGWIEEHQKALFDRGQVISWLHKPEDVLI